MIYEYKKGAKLFATCRQQAGCTGDISAAIYGTKGSAYFSSRGSYIETTTRERMEGERDNIYQFEHDEFFGSIRNRKYINNGEYMCNSTAIALMGRMAGYTGQTVTWDQLMNSTEQLGPTEYAWGDVPVETVAIPGKTALV